MVFFNGTQVIQKIKTTSMAPAGCHTHRHASRDSYYKNMISYITYIIHHILWPYYITKHLLQKQVRRPLIVVASFYVASIVALARTFLTYVKPQRDMPISIYPS